MYEINQLFFYKPIFMTELFIAEFLFSVRLKKKKLYWLRMVLSLLACYAAAIAFPLAYYNAAYCSFMFICFFGFTLIQLRACYDEKIINLLFCAIAGYTCQHISFVLYDFISNAAGLVNDVTYVYGNKGGVYAPFSGPWTALAYLFTFIVCYWSAFMVFGRKIKRGESIELRSWMILIVVAIVVIIDIVVSSLITYYQYSAFDHFYVLMLDFFNILCCLLTLYIQFELVKRRRLENEVVVLDQLLCNAKEQYEISKENIEMINIKCHDLKHQIRAFGSRSSLSDEEIKKMEKTISIYDSMVHTDNEALDIILSEKGLLCNKSGIKMSVMADGSLLRFMKESDIYSLFGNAIDNAIEAVAALPESERVIGVNVKRINGFLSIKIYNFFNKKLSFAFGLPQTTKDDTKHHGFGMKSIKMICEEYGGDILVQAENGVFNLNLLFPLDQEDE